MQNQRQPNHKREPERRTDGQRRDEFELSLPDGTDVSDIRVEVGQLNDINFGF